VTPLKKDRDFIRVTSRGYSNNRGDTPEGEYRVEEDSFRADIEINKPRKDEFTKKGPSSDLPPLFIDHKKLDWSIGQGIGKSKFMCVQFLLSVASTEPSGLGLGESGLEGSGLKGLALKLQLGLGFGGNTIGQTEVKSGMIKGDKEDTREREDKREDKRECQIETVLDILDMEVQKEVGKGEREGDLLEELLSEAKSAALKGLNDRSGNPNPNPNSNSNHCSDSNPSSI
jgi:hypothetical protein